MKLIDIIIDSFYPKRCSVCKALMSEGYLCENCVDKISFVEKPICIKCGNSIKKCQCDIYFYHFDGIVAPFVNIGATRSMFYAFKFSKEYDAVNFIVDHMTRLVAEHYEEINFDVLVYIPKKKNKFNQCKVLAKKLSKSLKLPLEEGLLVKIKSNKTQRKLSLNERFENVKNVYNVTGNLRGKDVLLLDDIKTTGATLNECARELKFAGANKVYCVTALIT